MQRDVDILDGLVQRRLAAAASAVLEDVQLQRDLASVLCMTMTEVRAGIDDILTRRQPVPAEKPA